MSPDQTYISLTVARTDTAAWSFRRALDSLYRQIPPNVLPTARLLVSELASNACRHGAGETINMLLERRGRLLRGEVTDDGDGFAPAPRTEGQIGGWGLELVDALAARWGIDEGSTHVWFELPLDREP